jgi:hypothetical protein
MRRVGECRETVGRAGRVLDQFACASLLSGEVYALF